MQTSLVFIAFAATLSTGVAVAQVQFISAAALTKLRRRSARLRTEKFPSIHLCWSRNKVCSMKRGRRVVSTRSGRTAMFHSTAVRICQIKLNRRSSDSRPVFAIVFSPAIQWLRLNLPDQIRIWPVVTSAAAQRTSCSYWRDRFLVQLLIARHCLAFIYVPHPRLPAAASTECVVITRHAQHCAIISLRANTDSSSNCTSGVINQRRLK